MSNESNPQRPDSTSIPNPKRYLTSHVSCRLTDQEKSTLSARAAAEKMSASEYARRLIVQSLRISAEARLAMEFSAIAEEKFRLCLIAAAKGENLKSPEVRETIERQAVTDAMGLADKRLKLIRQIQKGAEQA